MNSEPLTEEVVEDEDGHDEKQEIGMIWNRNLPLVQRIQKMTEKFSEEAKLTDTSHTLSD